MSTFPLKATHSPVKAYYAALAQFQLHGHTTEGNTRSAFADLLKRCCPPYAWHLAKQADTHGIVYPPSPSSTSWSAASTQMPHS